jgi:flagellar biosynthesis protein FlhG
MAAKIWVVGAGKGGVGKTFVSTNLGITLAKMNFKACVIDLDFSGANVHTHLGQQIANLNLGHFFSGEKKLSELLNQTEIPRLSYVQGFWDQWQPVDLTMEQVKSLSEAARALDFDYVIFDLGPGASPANLEIFQLADEKILVTNTEPTCIEKTYRYVESYICRSLQPYANKEAFSKLMESLKEYRSQKKVGHFSFKHFLKAEQGFSVDFFECFNKNPIRLIVNETRSRQDQDLGHCIRSVCQKYFDLKVDFVGAVDYDNAVWQSIRSYEPVLIEKPFTPLAGQFLSITKLLTNPNSNANLYRAVV